jgi:hypothetical protein
MALNIMSMDSVRSSLQPLGGSTPSLGTVQPNDSTKNRNLVEPSISVENDTAHVAELSGAQILALSGNYPPPDNAIISNDSNKVASTTRIAWVAAALAPLGSM